MIKCLFVDITSISSERSKAEFNDAEIERLADLILATGGLIHPLLLKQIAVDRYAIVRGDLEYYAAVRAKEKDLHKAETVNAFIVSEAVQQFALAQLETLSSTKSTVRSRPLNPVPSAADISPNESFERLASQLRAEILQQLHPLQQQLDTMSIELDRHKQILAALAIESVMPIVAVPTVLPIVEPEKLPSNTSSQTKPRSTANSKAEKKPSKLPESQPQQLKSAIDRTGLQPPASTHKKATTVKKTVPAATPSTDRVKSDEFGAVNPEKLLSTINLINTLTLNELTLSMAKSGIANAETLAINIIAKRDTQSQQRFETWESVILAKIPKLTTLKMAMNIINKLK